MKNIFIMLSLSISTFLFCQEIEDVLTNINSPHSIAFFEDTMFIGSSDGVYKVDMSSLPLQPEEVHQNSGRISIDGDFLYIGSLSSLIRINLLTSNYEEEELSVPYEYGVYSYTVSENTLFYSEDILYNIKKVDLMTNSSQTFSVQAQISLGKLVDNDILYFTQYDGGLFSININDENPTKNNLINNSSYNGNGLWGLCKKGNNIYVTESLSGNQGKVLYYDLEADSGQFQTLVSGLDTPLGISEYDNELYITLREANKVVKISTNLSTVDNAQTKHSIFPNPANNKIVISGNSFNKKNYQIFSNNGGIVQSGLINVNNEINISSLENGIYILKVEDSTFKLIKN